MAGGGDLAGRDLLRGAPVMPENIPQLARAIALAAQSLALAQAADAMAAAGNRGPAFHALVQRSAELAAAAARLHADGASEVQ